MGTAGNLLTIAFRDLGGVLCSVSRCNVVVQLTYTTARVGVYEFAKNKILKDTGGRT